MSHPAPPMAAQLWAFERDTFVNDIRGVLTRIADIGYKAVEGIPRHPVVYKDILDDLGLEFAAFHVTPKLMGDNFKSIIDYQESMGAVHICNSGPMSWMDRTADDFYRTCEYLNKAGKVFTEAGQKLHYHNHEFEFNEVEPGKTAMDIILENFDFNVVDLCVDIGFVWQMKVDPAAFLREHQDKIGYLHLRDFKGEESVPLGAGDIYLKPILEAVLENEKIPYLTAEQHPGRDDVYADLANGRKHVETVLTELESDFLLLEKK